MGRPIPAERKSAAYRAVKEMIPGVSTADAMNIVGRVSDALERDEPYQAIFLATGAPFDRGVAEPVDMPDGPLLDVTGGYRLLAHLLT